MAKKSHSQFRRTEILWALQVVMARSGYEKATIQSIASEAGLTPGLLHYYFKNKQEILVSLVTMLADYGQERYTKLVSDAGDPATRLRAYIDSRLGLGPGSAPEIVATWVMIGAEAVRQPEVKVASERAVVIELNLLTNLLADCMRQEGRDETQVRYLAAGVLALMQGAFQLACAAGEVMPVGYAAEAAWRHATLGIEAMPRMDRQR